MRHQTHRESLVLYIYDELDAAEEKVLLTHLAECEDCRLELEELKALQIAVDPVRAEPTAQLLQEARSQLRGALRAERQRGYQPGWLAPLTVVWDWLVRRNYGLTAAAGILAGIALGYGLFHGASGGPEDYFSARSEARVGDVEIVDQGSDGSVEVSFSLIRPVRLRGDLNDESIQRVLTQAMLGQANPGVRMQAVEAVASESPRQFGPKTRDALIQALRFDPNVGVRQRALDALRKQGFDPDIRDAFLNVLIHEENAAVRIDAIDALEMMGNDLSQVNPELLKSLEERLQDEENDLIRLRSKAFLREVKFQ